MRNILWLLSGLLLAGCASFNIVKIDRNKIYPVSDPASVKILTQEPSQPYVVIAEIRAQGETISRQDNMELRLREKAAAMGADAIILKVNEEYRNLRESGVRVESTYAVDINRMFTKKMVGKVIKFNKEPQK